MRLLFIKDSLSWPRSSGHDVHGYHLMRELSVLGHEISLATVSDPDPRAIEGAGLASRHLLDDDFRGGVSLNLSKMQERFRNYWGVPEGRIWHIGHLASELEADAVVVVGLNVLPYLGAVTNAQRIWYAGDEWAWHHLSQLRLFRRSTWGELKQATVKGLYERAYRSLVDRVWMVSETDRRALRWVTGCPNVDVLTNGVDADHFAPGNEPLEPRTCVFWGRLDFGPNIQALEWFTHNVWPRVRSLQPDARFTILGFQPSDAVRSLIREDQGIRLLPDLPDIRSEIRRHSVVVLPFVSGGGIKNKLLEAAALGKAIVATPRTVKGLSHGSSLITANSSRSFARELVALWNSLERIAELGQAARTWVVEKHTWAAAAKHAEAGLLQTRTEVVPA
ncbi:MAG: glycosyltransferase family 4 protein [Planctomycetes bacterium]|nr:glycosyltransferase family 4 protein [Planctomycetota bacterium]